MLKASRCLLCQGLNEGARHNYSTIIVYLDEGGKSEAQKNVTASTHAKSDITSS